jgi:hypothetical protein
MLAAKDCRRFEKTGLPANGTEIAQSFKWKIF